MAIHQSTKVKAIKEARELLQVFGFNGFSFQHIADRLRIKKPSLYNHFESKEELGLDLIEIYSDEFKRWTKTISIFDPASKIGALFELFYDFSSEKKRYCPCASLLADYNSLPKTMQKSLIKTCTSQKEWLVDVIKEGQKSKVFRRDLSPRDLARSLMALAYGSQQMGRAFQDSREIQDIKKTALELLKVG